MPVRKKKSVPQRFLRRRPPLTPMREPLTREEVQRLQAHMRKHGPHSLTKRQHHALWDFLFEVPESQAWLTEMVQHIQAGQQALGAHSSKKT